MKKRGVLLVAGSVADVAFAEGAAGAAVPVRADPVAKVAAGELKEARASWWGWNGVDDTAALQAAISSGVPKLVEDKMSGSWIMRPLFGLRNIRDYKMRIRPEGQSTGEASPFNVITEAMTLRLFTEQRSEVRGQRLKVGGQRLNSGINHLCSTFNLQPEVRGQRSEVRGQRSKVRGQRSKVRGQRR